MDSTDIDTDALNKICSFSTYLSPSTIIIHPQACRIYSVMEPNFRPFIFHGEKPNQKIFQRKLTKCSISITGYPENPQYVSTSKMPKKFPSGLLSQCKNNI